ncbi:unnamed protein product [Toxocara canis]|uniref:Nuclear receptor domain-containing protein n=1 Tax=Toxocara canis TaxID=6265 RepID=A0A183U0C4_TOXCA|nr:unnamed protein product [Toxocara canis]
MYAQHGIRRYSNLSGGPCKASKVSGRCNKKRACTTCVRAVVARAQQQLPNRGARCVLFIEICLTPETFLEAVRGGFDRYRIGDEFTASSASAPGTSSDRSSTEEECASSSFWLSASGQEPTLPPTVLSAKSSGRITTPPSMTDLRTMGAETLPSVAEETTSANIECDSQLSKLLFLFGSSILSIESSHFDT